MMKPLSAHSTARFWGACGGIKAMLAALRDRAVCCQASFLRLAKDATAFTPYW